MNDIQIIAERIANEADILTYYKDGSKEHMSILKDIEDLVYQLESHVKDQLYHYEETIDGQHAPF